MTILEVIVKIEQLKEIWRLILFLTVSKTVITFCEEVEISYEQWLEVMITTKDAEKIQCKFC